MEKNTCKSTINIRASGACLRTQNQHPPHQTLTNFHRKLHENERNRIERGPRISGAPLDPLLSRIGTPNNFIFVVFMK